MSCIVISRLISSFHLNSCHDDISSLHTIYFLSRFITSFSHCVFPMSNASFHQAISSSFYLRATKISIASSHHFPSYHTSLLHGFDYLIASFLPCHFITSFPASLCWFHHFCPSLFPLLHDFGVITLLCHFDSHIFPHFLHSMPLHATEFIFFFIFH